jgi:phosphotransferase system enzyme I (PtsI)
MCGAMAGDPLYIHILLGLDLDEISVNPSALPYARHLIRNSSYDQARTLTQNVMKVDTTQKANYMVREWMAECFPDFFTPQGHRDLLGGL